MAILEYNKEAYYYTINKIFLRLLNPETEIHVARKRKAVMITV
jgi:hypothetical protein